MDADFEKVLARFEARATEEQSAWEADPAAMMGRRDEMLLHVGDAVARTLHALATARNARHIVELGTSYGYSTLFLADAARRTGGIVHSFELADYKQDHARTQIADAGLADYVQWHLGDAVELIRGLGPSVDFVLIDLWKDLYVPCFEAIYPKLADQALIVADNMLFPEDTRPYAEAYRAAVKAKGDLQTMLLPIGHGIELSCLFRDEGR